MPGNHSNEYRENYRPPPEVAHVVKGLRRWIKARRDRGVPEQGYEPAEKFHACSESCILHDHER